MAELNPFEEALKPLLETLDVECTLLGILIGLLRDKGVIDAAELADRIEVMSRHRPAFQQQLLAIVQQPLSGPRQ